MRQCLSMVSVFILATACRAEGVYDPFGLFCWHVRGLVLENVRLTARRPDQRPAIALEDAANVTIDGKQVAQEQPPEGAWFLPAASSSAAGV